MFTPYFIIGRQAAAPNTRRACYDSCLASGEIQKHIFVTKAEKPLGILERVLGSGSKEPDDFTPERVAEKTAEDLMKTFSAAGFCYWCGNQTLEPGHAIGDALAGWYSLANLELVIAAWTAFDDRQKSVAFIGLTREALQHNWKMPVETYKKVRSIIEKTEPFSVDAFSKCATNADMNRFFEHYMWMVLGGPLITESLDQTRAPRVELSSEMPLCQLFLSDLAAHKTFLGGWNEVATKRYPNWWNR